MKYYNSEMAVAIAECVHNGRYRFILQRKFLDDWVIKDIAQHPKLDMSDRQVANIIDKFSEELFEFIKADRIRRGQ